MISAITFTSNMATDDKRKKAEKDIVTGGGAVAATTAATSSKAARSGFNMFASSKQVTQGMKNITDATKEAQAVTKKSMSLWKKVCENAKWAKGAILNWGSKFKSLKYVKPLVESRVFRGCAGVLGYGFGAITMISGLADIFNFASDAAQGHLLKNKNED